MDETEMAQTNPVAPGNRSQATALVMIGAQVAEEVIQVINPDAAAVVKPLLDSAKGLLLTLFGYFLAAKVQRGK